MAQPWYGPSAVVRRSDGGQPSRRRHVLLEVRSANIAAINLYKKTGFQTIGIRPNYYPQTGESALVMSKRLKEES
jgi:ribosomal protein S18 acetylase RimI-like enzyme